MKFLILLKTKTSHSLTVNEPGNLNFPQTQTISRTTRINFPLKMAETMFEVVLPDYFKKFQPKFKFVITEKNPNLSTF